MTCIAAIRHNGLVTMGCDSAGVVGMDLRVRSDPKIYRVGNILIGFTSSYRMGQLLGYQLQVPKYHPDADQYGYIATDFIEAVRSCLRIGGYTTIDNNQESGGNFLVAMFGRIFNVGSDFQVAENASGYDACGCGEAYALGAIRNSASLAPRDRIVTALETAAEFSAAVRGPFTVLDTPPS